MGPIFSNPCALKLYRCGLTTVGVRIRIRVRARVRVRIRVRAVRGLGVRDRVRMRVGVRVRVSIPNCIDARLSSPTRRCEDAKINRCHHTQLTPPSF